MKTPILILFSAFLTAACTNEPGPPAAVAGATNPVVSGFSTSEKDTLEIQVTDPQPVTLVELTAPDGRVFLSDAIDRERVVLQGGYGYGPDVGVGVGVGSGGHTGVGAGVGIGFPFVIGGPSEPRRPLVRSVARVRIGDMPAYRAQWQQWKLHVHLGEAPDGRVLEEAAPMPPPA
jgi:hypothetical protein